MRPRIKKVPVCSSNNYAQSLTNRREYIRDWHNKNKEEINKISFVKTHAYVMCFGKRIEISIEEAQKLETIKITYL